MARLGSVIHPASAVRFSVGLHHALAQAEEPRGEGRSSLPHATRQ